MTECAASLLLLPCAPVPTALAQHTAPAHCVQRHTSLAQGLSSPRHPHCWAHQKIPPSPAFSCRLQDPLFHFARSHPRPELLPGGEGRQGWVQRDTSHTCHPPPQHSLTSSPLMAFPWSQLLTCSQGDWVNQLLLPGPWVLINVSSLTR